jgi:hypothetical protein
MTRPRRAGGHLGQAHRGGLPTLVLEAAGEGGLPHHVAHQPQLGGVEAGGHRHQGPPPLRSAPPRARSDRPGPCGTRGAPRAPRPDVRVVVGLDLLGQKSRSRPPACRIPRSGPPRRPGRARAWAAGAGARGPSPPPAPGRARAPSGPGSPPPGPRGQAAARRGAPPWAAGRPKRAAKNARRARIGCMARTNDTPWRLSIASPQHPRPWDAQGQRPSPAPNST